ncbi:MAG: hypothetical protein JEZ08_22290 [Clostridiales bacterium]|nr:hypothetical protein [Clostridiales bacterium]
MELKRSMLKERISMVITLFNCVLISLFCILEFEDDMTFFVCIMVLLAVLRIYKHIRCMIRSPKLITIENHVIQFQYALKNKEITLDEIDCVELYINSNRTAVFVIKYKEKIIYLEKRLYKKFLELCDEFEGYSMNRFDYFLYKYNGRSIKNYKPYMENILWQDRLNKKYSLKDTKRHTILWVTFTSILLFVAVQGPEGVLKDKLINGSALLGFSVVCFALLTFYNYRGYSYSEALKKCFYQVIKVPVTLFSIMMCLSLIFNF